MPLINVLTEKEVKEYEAPPIFSSSERKHFLTMPVSIQKIVNKLSTTTNKVGFQLMFGYFLARKRFFFKEQFNSNDIRFLCGRLGTLSLGFDNNSYRQTTYTRHRRIILEYFAFSSYRPDTHDIIIKQAIKSQIYSWEDNSSIFKFILDWLEWRNIELPTYHNLQSVITLSIRERDKEIRYRFNRLLKDSHREALDELTEKQLSNGREEYVLTILQELSPSYSPKQIRANIKKYQLIKVLFETIHLLIIQMDFSDNAIRYFGEYVTATNAGNLNRRTDKYLYLSCFCIYQRAIFEDWMALTFLTTCKLSINKAMGQEKERLFRNRKQHNQAFNHVINIAQSSRELIKMLQDLTWSEISPIEKEKQFKKLLPLSIKNKNNQTDGLQQIVEEFLITSKEDYYTYLAEESQGLQQRVNPILKELTFNPLNSNKHLVAAIDHFKDKQGIINRTAPTDFLNDEERKVLVNQQDKFQTSLYKMLLFKNTADAIKRGRLNLKYSFNYKAMDEYLIPKHLWDKQSDNFLDKANLSHLKSFQNRMNDFKKMVSFHYKQTNEHILNGENKYFRQRKSGKYYVVTPKVEKEETPISIFPDPASINISEVLTTIDTVTGFLNEFTHLQPTYRKKRPSKSIFFAGITAYGCNIGISAMAKAVSKVQAKHLENTVNWFFTLENINRANDRITNFINKIPLADLYRKNKKELRTSSDGQKIKTISENTIFASYSILRYYRSFSSRGSLRNRRITSQRGNQI